MGRQAARLAPGIWVRLADRHYVTVTNLMCAAGKGNIGRQAGFRHCRIVGVRRCQLIVESKTVRWEQATGSRTPQLHQQASRAEVRVLASDATRIGFVPISDIMST